MITERLFIRSSQFLTDIDESGNVNGDRGIFLHNGGVEVSEPVDAAGT